MFFSCGWDALVGLVVGINLMPSALSAGLQSLVVGINLMRAPSLPPSSLPFLHLVVDTNLIVVVPLPVRWPARSEVPSNPPFVASPAFSVLLGVWGPGLEALLLPPSHTPMYIGLQLPLSSRSADHVHGESFLFRPLCRHPPMYIQRSATNPPPFLSSLSGSTSRESLFFTGPFARGALPSPTYRHPAQPPTSSLSEPLHGVFPLPASLPAGPSPAPQIYRQPAQPHAYVHMRSRTLNWLPPPPPTLSPLFPLPLFPDCHP